MNRFIQSAAGITLALAALALVAAAPGGPDVAPCKDGATIVPLNGAPLYRAESGLFQLQEDQVMDLTDRMVVFKFKRANQIHLSLYFNGLPALVEKGQRIDLTKWTGTVGDAFSDRKACFIDWIRSAKPRGAPEVAVFRFHCI